MRTAFAAEYDAAAEAAWAMLKAGAGPDVAARMTEGEHEAFIVGFAAGCFHTVTTIAERLNKP